MKPTNGKIDLTDAYDTKIGEWDKVSITYGYRDFPKGTNEKEALNKILDDAYAKKGLTFLSDQDARPAGSAHPFAHLWDNGASAADELNRMMEIRKVAIDKLGETSIRIGPPMATLEEVLVPMYFFHRYQAGKRQVANSLRSSAADSRSAMQASGNLHRATGPEEHSEV